MANTPLLATMAWLVGKDETAIDFDEYSKDMKIVFSGNELNAPSIKTLITAVRSLSPTVTPQKITIRRNEKWIFFAVLENAISVYVDLYVREFESAVSTVITGVNLIVGCLSDLHVDYSSISFASHYTETTNTITVAALISD